MTSKSKFSTVLAMAATGLIPGGLPTGDTTHLKQSPLSMDGEVVQITEPPTVSIDVEISSTSAKSSGGEVSFTTFMQSDEHWGSAAEARFKKLAVKEALDQLTGEEHRELERLDKLRESKLSPPSGEEAIRQYRGRQLTATLLTALEEYVAFFGHAPSTNISARSSGTYPEKPETRR